MPCATGPSSATAGHSLLLTLQHNLHGQIFKQDLALAAHALSKGNFIFLGHYMCATCDYISDRMCLLALPAELYIWALHWSLIPLPEANLRSCQQAIATVLWTS